MNRGQVVHGYGELEQEPAFQRVVRLARAIERALADPDPCASAEQFARYYGDDLSQLDLEGLDDERWRLRTGRAFGLLSPWGRERLARLDALADRLRRQGRRS